MISLNTLNIRASSPYEGPLFFSGIPIVLKPQQTGILHVRESSAPGQSPPPPNHNAPLLLADIGWTHLEGLETRLRLQSFEEDWNAPGMEGYDEL